DNNQKNELIFANITTNNGRPNGKGIMVFSHCPSVLATINAVDTDQGRIHFTFSSNEICPNCNLKGHNETQCHVPLLSLDVSIDDEDVPPPAQCSPRRMSRL